MCGQVSAGEGVDAINLRALLQKRKDMRALPKGRINELVAVRLLVAQDDKLGRTLTTRPVLPAELMAVIDVISTLRVYSDQDF